MNEILISIGSCDSSKDLKRTVESAFYNAENPNNLFFSIFWHPLFEDNLETTDIKNINLMKANYKSVMQMGLSRFNATLIPSKNTKYFLQIDSHMIFEKNWDTEILDCYTDLQKENKKIIISGYVPWWYEKNNLVYSGITNKEIKNINNFYEEKNIARCSPMDVSLEDYPKAKGKVDSYDQDKNIEHYLISGHFFFTEKKFIYELMPDPLMLHGPDEVLMGMRAYTRGYKIFAIKNSICWHKNKNNEDMKIDWRNPNNREDKYKNMLFETYTKKLCFERTKNILTGKEIGYWGSPSIKKLKEYEKKCNVNFIDFYKTHSPIGY
jgi:hypothetical protein